MTRLANPLMRPRTGSIVAQAAAIKSWTRSALVLDNTVVVSVNELACAIPGCPPQETVVLVLRAGSAVKLSIHKAIVDVVEEDVMRAAREGEALSPTSAIAS